MSGLLTAKPVIGRLNAVRATGSDAAAGLGRAMLFPGSYLAFVLLAAADIACTWTILLRGGWEVNALANWVIEAGGLPGTIAFKFGIVLAVVAICEYVGLRRWGTAQKLARSAVGITAFPVAVGGGQLLLAAL
jgi:hypothetical protein